MLQDPEIAEILKKLKDKGNYHYYYDKSVKIAKKIEETFSDEFPPFLKVLRPNEPTKDKKYRESIYENPIKGHKSRIIDKLVKVEQSEDFQINYPLNESGKNELQDYCEKGFKGYGNITNWAFGVALNAYINDSNSVVAVLDKEPPVSQSDSYKPFPYIFSSENVIFFKRNEYCVLVEKNEKVLNENIYYIIDDTNYYIFKERDNINKTTYTLIGGIPHYCRQMPAFKIGKHLEEENQKGEQLFKSTISDALTDFRKAITRANDIEIELLHHLTSLEWRMSPKKCTKCKGEKVISTVNGKIECETCKGSGLSSWGALDVLEVDMFEDKFLQGAKSFPFNSPGGYVQRNIEALRELKLSFDAHIDNAYEAIDFGILRKKEINNAESGLSKQYNRLEFSQRIYSEGRHFIENILVPTFNFIERQLFGIRTDETVLSPDITVPISFDVMSPEMILAEIKTATESGVSKEIIGALELKYAKIVFGEKAKETMQLLDEINLNPSLGKSADELITLLGGGKGSVTNGLDEIYFVIASNFKGFLDRAMREDLNWHLKEDKDKFEVLISFAKEVIGNRTEMPQLPNIVV